MKDILKNSKFYFLLIPALSAIWPIWVAAVSLPNARQSWQKDKKQYLSAQAFFLDILKLDPDRLNLAEARANAGAFDYSTEVEKIARITSISDYKLNISQAIRPKRGGQEIQAANLTIENVGIVKFTQFLAAIQQLWPNLQCSQLKLTKQKGLPDSWKINLKFKYYK